MIQPQSLLQVADNSGARLVKCIRVIDKNQNQSANIGDIIIGVIQESLPNMNVKKSEIVRAVIVRTVQGLQRKNGMGIKFDDNAVVLINPDGAPLGTRIFGPVARELRDQYFIKIISLAPEVL